MAVDPPRTNVTDVLVTGAGAAGLRAAAAGPAAWAEADEEVSLTGRLLE